MSSCHDRSRISCVLWLVSVLCIVSLSGCGGTVYLHRAKDAKAMAEGVDGLKKVRAGQEAFFKEQQEALNEGLKAERAALVDLGLSHRDLDLAIILEEKSKGRTAAEQKAWEKITARLKELVDPTIDVGTFDAPKSFKLYEALDDLRSKQSGILRDRHVLESLQRVYRHAGAQGGLECLPDGTMLPAQLPAGVSSDARGAHVSFGAICSGMRGEEKSLEQLRDAAQPAWVAVLRGSVTRNADLGDGLLKDAAVEAANLRALLNAERTLAAKANEHYKTLQKYLQCLQQQSAQQENLEQRVAEASKQLEDFIEWLAEMKETDATQPPPSQGAQKQPDVCASAETGKVQQPPQVASLEQLAGDDGSLLDEVQKALAAANKFAPARSFVASLQSHAQEIREHELGVILGRLADPAGAASTDKDVEIAVQTIRLVSRLADLRGSKIPPLSGVLIELADTQLKSNNARIEADRLAELSRLADLRLLAVRNELMALMGGIDAVVTHKAPRLPTFVRTYNDAWLRGRLQQMLIDADMLNQEYVAWGQRQRVAADAIHAMLEPVFAELKTHADGGFTAQEIAGYLQTLGIGAIAVGTN